MKSWKNSLRDQVGSADFDAKTFVADVLRGNSGDVVRNLRALRSATQVCLQFFANDCMAKVLLELEGELSTFGQLLGDQKLLVESMMSYPFSQTVGELRSFTQRIPERRNLVQQLLDAVENCVSQLRENPERELVFESDLTQLNPENMIASAPSYNTATPSPGGVQGKRDSAVDLEWIKELPDELDVCIAQRDFSSALDLLSEARDFLAECADKELVDELSKKFDQRQKQLAEKLIKELKPVSDKYLQGGPRATRKATTLLIKLGRISEACDLYLKNRSASIKFSIKELKVIDNAVQYVEQLNRAICNVIVDTVREFKKLFAGHSICFSVLAVWASSELKSYATLFLMHVFDSGCSLSVAARCITLAFNSLESLTHVSLDLSFQLEILLHQSVDKLILDVERLIIDAVNLRIAEDRWRPYNLQSESNLAKCVQDMKECGVDVSNAVCDGCRLWLTSQVCNFARSVVPFTRDLALLREAATFVSSSCDSALLNVWSVELAYLSQKPSAVDENVYKKNVEFVVGYLLPLCEQSYERVANLQNFLLLKQKLNECAEPLVQFYQPFTDETQDFEAIGEV
ncbi:exocyst complex component 8 [Trichuris trichiura]|uniref:Exocyst complex component 8 n=1 Tax=Trichuris trichiura TaxID=36087 RepID=A0A077ZBK0_TRITR|nr:exocyst complex component 8 [Trichuris trichiura]